jgi:hypothetical protein
VSTPHAGSVAAAVTGGRAAAALDPTDVDDEGVRTGRTKIPPPVLQQQHQQQGPGSPQAQRQTKPSMPVEMAANPKFDITVGDPHKVGDLTSHIVYQVRTKVKNSSRPLFFPDIYSFCSFFFLSIRRGFSSLFFCWRVSLRLETRACQQNDRLI